MDSGENESYSLENESRAQEEDKFLLIYTVSSPNGEEGSVKLQDERGISVFKMKLSSALDLLLRSLYKLEQQMPEIAKIQCFHEFVAQSFSYLLISLQEKKA